MPSDDWSIEANLYPPFRVWQNLSFHHVADLSGDHITAEVANRRAVRGRAQIPDFLRFDLPQYRFSKVKEIVATSLELKTTRASVIEVTDQVKEHQHLAHYAWAVVHNWTPTKIANLRNDAANFGFGVIQIPEDPRTSGYIIETEPEFRPLSLALLDALILTYLTRSEQQQIEKWLGS